MEEYKQWLEQQIERCLNDKDLQREHWAFCKAYEKFTALRQPPVSGSASTSCLSTNETTTSTTIWKGGWVSDNFSTYYLDENMVKHYR